jgi:hypothetical protein
MLEKACSAPIFFALFGVLFLYFGAQRLLKLPTEPSKRDAVVWGSVGIALGLAFLWMAAWFFTGDPAETRRQLDEIRSRRVYP